MSKERKPWERQEWETSAAYRAFSEFYLSQEPTRSINAAFRNWRIRRGFAEDPNRTATGCWKNWSLGRGSHGEVFEDSTTWIERAAAWDEHLIAARQAGIEKVQAEADAPWLEKAMRKAEALGRLADMGRANPADFLVREPQAITLGSGENAKTIWIESASLNWEELRKRGFLVKKISFNQYGPIIELKDSSGAIEKIGENLNIFRQQTPTNLNLDLSQLTEEQLERIANGEDPVTVLATSSQSGA